MVDPTTIRNSIYSSQLCEYIKGVALSATRISIVMSEKFLSCSVCNECSFVQAAVCPFVSACGGNGCTDNITKKISFPALERITIMYITLHTNTYVHCRRCFLLYAVHIHMALSNVNM